MWWQRYFLKMDKAGDGTGGAGGAGTPPPPADNAKDVETLRAQNADLVKRLEALEGKNIPPPKDEEKSLAEKAAKEREDNDKRSGDQKTMESALKFNLQGKDWLKTNASLLPKNIEGIFQQAEKENYGSAMEKTTAIKVGIISEFFSIQANSDLLTPGLKNTLDDFQKLTKNGKSEKANQVYDQVFEPAFEMLKRIKKAEQLNKGHGNPSDVEDAYKKRLMQGSRKRYLGEKQDA
jgi:hypothetical protein